MFDFRNESSGPCTSYVSFALSGTDSEGWKQTINSAVINHYPRHNVLVLRALISEHLRECGFQFYDHKSARHDLSVDIISIIPMGETDVPD